MLIIYFIFVLNILLLFIKSSQIKYILFLISLLYLSLYFLNYNYSVDYTNYIRFWNITADTNFSEISLKGEFIYTFFNKILSLFTQSFSILPISILILSLTSFYIILNSNFKSSHVLLSSLSYPIIGYLSFHNYRQAMSVSFILIMLTLILNNQKFPNKIRVFF